VATTRFDLVTPMRTLYSGEAEMIVCRTVDGEIAFLANHMPYIGALEAGLVRIVNPGAQPEGSAATAGGGPGFAPEVRLAVHGGFVEVKDNQVIMLADIAEESSEVDVEQARRDENDATQRVAAAGEGAGALAAAEVDLRWAQARLEAAQAQAHT
jgi:F-type H+-transporting ATPase subunit epsilon